MTLNFNCGFAANKVQPKVISKKCVEKKNLSYRDRMCLLKFVMNRGQEKALS